MLKFFTYSVHVHLSRTRITVVEKRNWPRAKVSVMADAALPDKIQNDYDCFNHAFRAIFNQVRCQGLPLYVRIADELVRYFIVTPPKNIDRLADMRAATAMRFQKLYDEKPDAWDIAGDWDTAHPFLACALPKVLLSSVRDVARQNDLKIVCIQPDFALTYNRYRKQLGMGVWLGSVQEDALCLGVFDTHRICGIRQIAVPDSVWESESAVSSLIKREALRLALPAPRKVYLYGGLPGDWEPSEMKDLRCIEIVDFIGENGHRPPTVENLAAVTGSRV